MLIRQPPTKWSTSLTSYLLWYHVLWAKLFVTTDADGALELMSLRSRQASLGRRLKPSPRASFPIAQPATKLILGLRLHRAAQAAVHHSAAPGGNSQSRCGATAETVEGSLLDSQLAVLETCAALPTSPCPAIRVLIVMLHAIALSVDAK